MAIPPRYPWYRRGWGYVNRPVAGVGCLWTLLSLLLVYFLLSLLVAPLRFY